MPQTDWRNMKHSGDQRRRLAGERVSRSGESLRDLMENSRKQLNEIAKASGITDAETLSNKRAVAEAILNA